MLLAGPSVNLGSIVCHLAYYNGPREQEGVFSEFQTQILGWPKSFLGFFHDFLLGNPAQLHHCPM